MPRGYPTINEGYGVCNFIKKKKKGKGMEHPKSKRITSYTVEACHVDIWSTLSSVYAGYRRSEGVRVPTPHVGSGL